MDPPWRWEGCRCHRREQAEPEAPEGEPMAGRRFLVAEVVEALRLWHAGHSIRRLAKSVGMGRVRLREVIARVQEAGVVPGDRSRSEAEWEELVWRLFPERVVVRPGGARARIEPYHQEIVAGLETNTVTTVWQRLRDERGLEGCGRRTSRSPRSRRRRGRYPRWTTDGWGTGWT